MTEAGPHAVRVAPVAGAGAEAGVGAHKVGLRRTGRVVVAVVEVGLRSLETGAEDRSRPAQVKLSRGLLAGRNLLLAGKLGLTRHK